MRWGDRRKHKGGAVTDAAAALDLPAAAVVVAGPAAAHHGGAAGLLGQETGLLRVLGAAAARPPTFTRHCRCRAAL